MEKPLHHSQKFIEEKNGSFLFELNLRISPDFVSEMMKYISGISEISSDYLKEKIQENIDNYQVKP